MSDEAVVHVADEVLGRDLPVAVHRPAPDLADHLGSALAPIQHQVHVPRHVPEILKQRGGLRIEGSKHQTLVRIQLRHRHQAPLAGVEVVEIAVLEVGH